MRTWLAPRELIDGTGTAPRRDVAVAIAGERVERIAPRAAIPLERGDVLVEEPALTLLPGFIDSHVHLVFDHGPDHATTRAAVERASLEALARMAARNAQACLLAGVTTVRDCGGRGMVTCAVRDAVATGRLTGPRILAAGPAITTTGGHLHWCGRIADDAAELRAAVDELCDAGVDLIKVMATGGRMTAGSDPLRPQYEPEQLDGLVAAAHARGRPVAAHVLSAGTLPMLVAARVDTLEHCLWTAPDGGSAYDASLAERIAELGIGVGVTMTGLDRAVLSAGDPDAARATLRERHADTRRLLEAGARAMVSSDAGVRNTRFEEFALSLECAVHGLDIDPVEAIHRATQVPAEALGVAAELGTVAPGRLADLVLVEGNPATRIEHVAHVRQVWRSGRRLVHDGLLAAPAGPVGRPA